MPVSTGRNRSSSVKASSPPAEAPIPTIGKEGFPDGIWGDEVLAVVVFIGFFLVARSRGDS
jgi:hypothetical protein